MEIIKTEQLSKSYGKARGIVNLNLSVEEGDFFGFIGPNGAGKSTTIRTLLGLIKPTGGKAEIFSKDIVTYHNEILKNIGFMPSDSMFYKGMKVKDCIKFSADLRKVDCKEEAEKLCERLQLDTTKKIDDLSLGNRKKVCIVCALQHKPKLYILDEPTSGLDPLIHREFFKILAERNKEGATVFLSSHVLSEIQNYCRHAAIIREGKLIASDSVANLMKTKAKRVTVIGGFSTKNLCDYSDLKISEDNTTFLYSGEINKLLAVLSSEKLKDVSITDPDLEEIFMHYYDGSEK